MEGVLNIQQNADNTEVWYLLPFKDYRAVVFATFYSDGESIFKDVTDNYKKTYPHIKKVELQAICAIEWRKRSIPTHSGWLYPLTFDAGKGLKEA